MAQEGEGNAKTAINSSIAPQKCNSKRDLRENEVENDNRLCLEKLILGQTVRSPVAFPERQSADEIDVGINSPIQVDEPNPTHVDEPNPTHVNESHDRQSRDHSHDRLQDKRKSRKCYDRQYLQGHHLYYDRQSRDHSYNRQSHDRRSRDHWSPNRRSRDHSSQDRRSRNHSSHDRRSRDHCSRDRRSRDHCSHDRRSRDHSRHDRRSADHSHSRRHMSRNSRDRLSRNRWHDYDDHRMVAENYYARGTRADKWVQLSRERVLKHLINVLSK
ncbi:uncharacterized protein [Temnothorax nylanderi]|uniref:uncharacterized protein isoform X1 n=1 Tax=Temnothorax nylanderi TaxID=102681 RepID=UPI003A883378